MRCIWSWSSVLYYSEIKATSTIELDFFTVTHNLYASSKYTWYGFQDNSKKRTKVFNLNAKYSKNPFFFWTAYFDFFTNVMII